MIAPRVLGSVLAVLLTFDGAVVMLRSGDGAGAVAATAKQSARRPARLVSPDSQELSPDVGHTKRELADKRAARAWLDRYFDFTRGRVREYGRIIFRVRQLLDGDTDDGSIVVMNADAVLPTFIAIRRDLQTLPVLPQSPPTRDTYVASYRLYAEVIRLYRALAQDSVARETGRLRRAQLSLMAQRLKLIADRVFDRGLEELESNLLIPDDPLVQLKLSEEVPTWIDEQLAAGPPLDDPPPATANLYPLRADERPVQPRARWVADVQAAGAPSSTDLAQAIDDADLPVAGLRDLARGLEAAVERLRPIPDPPRGRQEFARVRLGLLLQAEAARVAHMSRLVPDRDLGGRMRAIARRLVLIGDELWAAPGLPQRSSGYPVELLDDERP